MCEAIAMLWQILIPTIPHRHAKLTRLLAALNEQIQPEVQVLVWRDNLEASYAEKLQGLLDVATAEYISYVADDDLVSPDFVSQICAALKSSPDYVGFRVKYTEGGYRQRLVIHSLRCGSWSEDDGELRRDLMYYNPIQREIAAQVRFRGPFCDTEWADDLRALGCVQKEVFIDAELYYYQRDSADNFHTARQPMNTPGIQNLPQYRWLTSIREAGH